MINIEGEGGNFANKNLQNVLHAVVHRCCQSVLYFQNLMPFHSTRLHVMPLTPITCNAAHSHKKNMDVAAPIIIKRKELCAALL
jgi:hypothetical protein